jgi:hypothetical protein
MLQLSEIFAFILDPSCGLDTKVLSIDGIRHNAKPMNVITIHLKHH